MCLSIPAKIESIDGEMAVCSVGGTTYTASLQMLDPSELVPGDYVLLHTGFALQKISKEEAEAQFGCCTSVPQLCGITPRNGDRRMFRRRGLVLVRRSWHAWQSGD